MHRKGRAEAGPLLKLRLCVNTESGSQSRLRSHLNIHYETGSGTGCDPEERNSGGRGDGVLWNMSAGGGGDEAEKGGREGGRAA